MRKLVKPTGKSHKPPFAPALAQGGYKTVVKSTFWNKSRSRSKARDGANRQRTQNSRRPRSRAPVATPLAPHSDRGCRNSFLIRRSSDRRGKEKWKEGPDVAHLCGRALDVLPRRRGQVLAWSESKKDRELPCLQGQAQVRRTTKEGGCGQGQGAAEEAPRAAGQAQTMEPSTPRARLWTLVRRSLSLLHTRMIAKPIPTRVGGTGTRRLPAAPRLGLRPSVKTRNTRLGSMARRKSQWSSFSLTCSKVMT